MKLGINTGFAVNRFPRPEQWLRVIGDDLGLKYVQLTADMINPSLDDSIIRDLARRINNEKAGYNIVIDSVMTGAFTRVNHFSHPDEVIRNYWKKWFKRLADVTVSIGANNLSSHLGILCYEDLEKRKNFVLNETIKAWKELARYGENIGLKYLSWEPMSIKREYGETIKEAERINKLLEGSAIPINLCLDVSHGDVMSKNPDDTDYRKWVEKFGKISPLIHIKQVIGGSFSHHPFVPEYNKGGKIYPKDVVSVLEKHGRKDCLLLFELGFREREPADSLVLEHLKKSVEYWKRYIK